MVRTWLGLLGIFLVTAANAVTPSSPFTAVNSDGRPMTGATVTVTDELGMPAMDLYMDSAGTVPYNKVVPSTGIVQFFGQPKTYIVTVSGSGVTRQFYVNLAGGGGTGGGGGLTEGDFGPGDGLLRKLGSGSYGLLKVYFSSFNPPGAGDDKDHGFSVGSFWIDMVTTKSYQCVNAASGAAVWKQISNEIAGPGGGGNIADGTAVFQVPYWTGTQWQPSSALWSNQVGVGIGGQGIVDLSAKLQLSKNSAGPNILLWNSLSNVVLGTELGMIEFGATDSSATPRKSIRVVGRATGTWGADPNDSASSLDFRVQDGTSMDLLPFNALRIIGFHDPQGFAFGKVVAGGGIPDVPTITAPTAFSTSGIDIYEASGGANPKAVSLVTPAGMANNLLWNLPNTNGTSGQALTTDGAVNAQLHWTSFAPGLHAAQHSIGGIDETQSYDQIFDEAVLMPPRRILAFYGAGVTCADSSTKTICTIAGGGGGSGISSINTDTSASQTFSTGTTGTDFSIVSNLAGDHKFNIPDASFTARGFMTTGNQAFNGIKSFQGIVDEGTAVFNNTGAAINFQVKSDTNNNAIFVDGGNDSVGIFTNTPNILGLHPNTFAVSALTGKHGIYAQAVSGSDAVHAISGSSGSAAFYGLAVASGDSSFVGEANNGGAHAAYFKRNQTGSVPIVQIDQLSNNDAQPLLDLVGGNGQYQISGRNTGGGGAPNWGIDSGGHFITPGIFSENDFINQPNILSLFNPTSGFYISVDGFPGLVANGTSGFHIRGSTGFDPVAVITTSNLVVVSAGLPTTDSYLATFAHNGGGNGVKIDNSTGLASTNGLYVIGGKDVVAANAARFDAQVGTAVNARQTGSFTGAPASSTAPIVSATREVVLTGGAALSGPLYLGVDNSNTTGRLLDLQRPAFASKFWIDNVGSTTIDASLSPIATPGLTVHGPRIASVSAAVFDTPVGIVGEFKQTGTTTATGIDPALKVTKNTVFTGGGISSGALILGRDDTGGIGDLLVLEQPAGVPVFKVSHTGEIGWLGVAFDGTGKVLCNKANGEIGTCSTVINATGVCTCG